MDFKEKAIFLLAFSALALPLAVLSDNLLESAVFIVLFIVFQAAMLYLFFEQEEAGFVQWYVFWAVLAGIAYMASLLVNSRILEIELLGFLLFIGYLVSIAVIGLSGKPLGFFGFGMKKEELTDEDIGGFRKRDDLSKLIDAFEISPPPQETRHPEDELIEDSYIRPRKDFLFEVDDADQQLMASDHLGDGPVAEPFVTAAKEDGPPAEAEPDRIEDHVEVFPKAQDEAEETREIYLGDSRKIDFGKMEENLASLDSGLKNLNEKIRLIGEKAILEAAEKKLEIATGKTITNQVFASRSGSKYHADRNCLGLQRVSKKDLITFNDSIEARKKKLKPCTLCRK